MGDFASRVQSAQLTSPRTGFMWALHDLTARHDTMPPCQQCSQLGGCALPPGQVVARERCEPSRKTKKEQTKQKPTQKGARFVFEVGCVSQCKKMKRRGNEFILHAQYFTVRLAIFPQRKNGPSDATMKGRTLTLASRLERQSLRVSSGFPRLERMSK